MVMESIGVALLKSKLSHFLAAVKKGKEFIVTSHQHPIARLAPVKDDLRPALEVTPAKNPISSVKNLKGVKLKVDLVADLLADRRRQ
jgi:prevent-host-death family protein